MENKLWNLDDDTKFVHVHSFELQEAFTYGDMRKGCKDKDKRHRIRAKALERLPETIPTNVKCWAFRIHVKKSGNRSFDIENVPKLIIDSFCGRQIKKDRQYAACSRLDLYRDDTIKSVRLIEVDGEPTNHEDSMKVEIYGYVGN
jgi:hypothetical protein